MYRMGIPLLLAFLEAWIVGCAGGDARFSTNADAPEAMGEDGNSRTSGNDLLSAQDRAGKDGAASVCLDPGLLAGRTFRADVLQASHPTDLLNEFFQQSADRFELIMVIHFRQYHPDTGILDATIGAATAVVGKGDCETDCGADCETDCDPNADPDPGKSGGGAGDLVSYSWALEPATIGVKTEGCGFEVVEEFDLDICAASASKVLGLKNMMGKGTLSPDGSRLRFDDLAGYLPESEVVDLCIGMPMFGTVNFHWFMNKAGICALADSGGDGSFDAYQFKGIVEALDDSSRFVDDVSAPAFGVTECPPDTGKCSE